MGATKARLAEALGISRQSIHNYTETKKYFGIEGLIHNYRTSTSKSRRRQRKNHASRRGTGNKARQLEKIRKEKKQEIPLQTNTALWGNNLTGDACRSTLCRNTRLEANPIRWCVHLFDYIDHPTPVASVGHGAFRQQVQDIHGFFINGRTQYSLHRTA